LRTKSAVPASAGGTGTGSIRVASVPAGHVYVRHLSAPSGRDAVVRLADPIPRGKTLLTGQWWPPVMLSPSWVLDHHDEFDVFHIQFGFDAQEASCLSELAQALRSVRKPLVYTVHDLRNPHHADRRAHDAHLDVLISQSDSLITLTAGAAAEVQSRWGRRPVVLPHPHVIELDRIPPRRRPGSGFVVGVHAKSVRASMAPLPVVQALAAVVPALPGARLQVNIHHDVFDPGGLRHDPELVRYLTAAAASGQIELHVHDCFSDEELWAYLESLDVSVLPYRFGTHSGWLEACHDLGTTVIVPSCGYFGAQRPCLSYHHDESGFDPASLQDAVLEAYQRRPCWQARREDRRRERAGIADAHRRLYEQLLG
jgi:glycosyltransferase involved in cell wall biosynthesis